MKLSLLFLLPPLATFGAYNQAVMVDSNGVIVSPTNLFAANSMVQSVNGKTGTVSLTASDVGALPATVSALSLANLTVSTGLRVEGYINGDGAWGRFSALTVSGGTLNISGQSDKNTATLSLGPSWIKSSYSTTSGVTVLEIGNDANNARLSVPYWLWVAGAAAFHGKTSFNPQSNVTFSGNTTFSKTPTISPTRWYAVFHIPQGAPKLNLYSSIQGYVPVTSVAGRPTPATTSNATARTYRIEETHWTDFKLKGYEQSPRFASDTVDLKFRYVSYDPSYAHQLQIGTTRPDIYFTRSSSLDPRYWVKQDTIHSVGWYLGASGRVGGWVAIATDNGGWFNPYNKNLVWAYALSTVSGPETDSNGNTIWRPIYPHWTDRPLDLATNP